MSDAGKSFFDAIKPDMEYREINVDILVAKNQRIVSPAKVDTRYKIFRKKFDLNPENIKDLCEQYEKPTFVNRISAKLRSMKQM